MRARTRPVALGVALVLVALGLVASPGTADAHPSAFDALTVDLLFDQPGLVVIDGAVNRESYDPDAPGSGERAMLAARVLEALGVPRQTAQIDPETSTLYHEVGFNVALHEAFANGDVPGAVHIDTAELQQVAADYGRLILDVCGVATPGLRLTLTASSPATTPDPGGAGAPQTDRTDCRTWTLHAGDAPVVITAAAEQDGASVPTVRERVTLPCGSPSTGDFTFVVNLPIAQPAGTLQARATGTRADHLLQADTVFEFWASTRVDLVVPKRQVGHVSFGPRDGPRASRQLSMPICPSDPAHPWTVSVVRIWVDRPACVPVLAEGDHARRTIRLAVGAPCPRTR